MKQILFIAAAIAYVVTGLIGTKTYAYVDMESLDSTISRLRIPLILLSLLVAAAFFYGFIKAFPRGFAQQKMIGRIAMPIAFVLISFAINKGLVIIWNSSLGKQETFDISGKVTDRWKDRDSRRSWSHYLIIDDTVKGKQYRFRTGKYVYDNFNLYSEFSRKFTTGSLGIIYRDEW